MMRIPTMQRLKVILETSYVTKITFMESYSMVVLYIRDHAVLRILVQKYYPKTSLKFPS